MGRWWSLKKGSIVDHKFDAMAKAMATGQTRREALRWLSGILGGALMGSPLMGYGASPTNSPEARSIGGGIRACNNFCKMNTVTGC
jgi:hypothetical protein